MLKRVVPKEAAALVNEGWTYVDVRSVPEFEQGHPLGAVNVPFMNLEAGRMIPNPEFSRIMRAEFQPESKLVIGCKSGGRSAQASALLTTFGYAHLADVRGGFHGERDALGRVVVAGWFDEALPTSVKAEAGRTYAELLARHK